MKLKSSSFSGYCVGFLLLQVMTSTSEKWTVTIPTAHLVAIVGGQTELHCQLSPPQSAKYMEVSWFKGDHSKLVHLYRDGHEVKGEAAPEYVDRTEFVKEAIGEGKVALRLHNIRVSDNGTYQCSFKDSNFSSVASMDLSVAATSLGIQILVHPPNTKGLLVECNTGGWFPQPQMEWRDSRGEIIPPTSISHSQDTEKLFHMKMTLLLKQSSHRNVTCCLRNPVTGQEERTSIVLSDQLFPWNLIWRLILGIILALLVLFIMVPSIDLYDRLQDCLRKMRNPIVVGIIIILLSIGVIASLISYLHHKIRVPASDPHFQLDTMWLEDITVILCVLTVFITMIISFIYFRFRGKWDGK
uniref:Ig-like domain-containing protein n=1 Tax=Myotis lucifugus TaxID=59463 RepID=G1PZ02_MYOLU